MTDDKLPPAPLDDLVERERRLQADADPELPLVQIISFRRGPIVETLTTVGKRNNFADLRRLMPHDWGDWRVVATLWPGDFFALLSGHLIDRAKTPAIDQQIVDDLARLFGLTDTDLFQYRVNDVVYGSAMVMLHDWWGLKRCAELLSELSHDPVAACERHCNDPFAELVIMWIARSVDIDLHNPIAVLGAKQKFVEAIRPLFWQINKLLRERGWGHYKKPTKLFWQEVARIVREYHGDLKLPHRRDREARGERATTVYFEFAVRMRAITIDAALRLMPPGADLSHIDSLREREDEDLINDLKAAAREISR